MMLPCAYVGLGSNIDAERNVRAALHELARESRVLALSTFYRTAPIGHPDDPWFINGVIALETDRSAASLKRDLLGRIETDLGRCRGPDRDAPRTIDLDLLAYATDGRLTAPADPQIGSRAFLACALMEVAPGLELGGRSIQEIAASISRDGMVPLPELTNALRSEFLALIDRPRP